MTDHKEPNLEVMANNIEHIMKDVDEVKVTLGSKYVTTDQFEPIKKIVYGLVTLVMTAVVGGLLGLVILR